MRANSDYYIEKKQLRHARKTSSSNFSQEALYQMMKAVINSDEQQLNQKRISKSNTQSILLPRKPIIANKISARRQTRLTFTSKQEDIKNLKDEAQQKSVQNNMYN